MLYHKNLQNIVLVSFTEALEQYSASIIDFLLITFLFQLAPLLQFARGFLFLSNSFKEHFFFILYSSPQNEVLTLDLACSKFTCFSAIFCFSFLELLELFREQNWLIDSNFSPFSAVFGRYILFTLQLVCRIRETSFSLQTLFMCSQINPRQSLSVSFMLSLTGGFMILLLSYYSLGLLKLAKQLLLRISAAVGLFLGLICNILTIKSITQAGVPALNHQWYGFGLAQLTCYIIVSAFSAQSDSIYCFEGFPVKASILSIWFSTEEPGKMGLPMRIQAKMQPTLQMSAALPQECEPSRTSGARYHLVATYSVRMRSWLNLSASKDLASPKSQIFMVQSLLRSRLEGLRSRWMTSAECRNLMPLQSWYRMNRWCASVSIF